MVIRSFAPLGLAGVSHPRPRLTPWAAFLRRFAAGDPSGAKARTQLSLDGTAKAVP
jgi:hypothetical protein